MQLDKKLNFAENNSKVESKVSRTIGNIRKLLAICKSFIRPHLDYGDKMYDKACNESFQAKLESLQYNAGLTIN